MSLIPAEVFPPGEYIKDALEERGWTQQDLADIMGRPLSAVSELISGKRGITADTAQGLAAAFDTSPELWLNLESKYRLYVSEGAQVEPVRKRAKLYEFAPIREMISRGWIVRGSSDDELDRSLCRFFNVSTLHEEPEPLVVAARKATSYRDDLTPAQRAWIQRVKNLGAAQSLPGFSRARLEDAIAQLKAVLDTPDGVGKVAAILANAGVAFVVVRHLSGTKFDGACVYASDRPIIAVSLRYGRIDHFWFVLFHEIGHLLQKEEAIDEDIVGGRLNDDERPVEEVTADRFAASTLVDQARLDAFIEQHGQGIDVASIRSLAEELGVHPALVVGQLQHRGAVGYQRFRRELIDIRAHVVRNSMSDGWEAA